MLVVAQLLDAQWFAPSAVKREREMLYLTTHSTHFIYGYMASDMWFRTILIVRKETRCRHIGYSYRLTARVLLYAPCYIQDNTYHGLCYTSRGALAGTRNSSMGPPHEGSIRRPTAQWANALPLSYVPLIQRWRRLQGYLLLDLCLLGRGRLDWNSWRVRRYVELIHRLCYKGSSDCHGSGGRWCGGSVATGFGPLRMPPEARFSPSSVCSSSACCRHVEG